MKYDEIRLAWNAQADDEKQWNSLTEAEKIEWAASIGAVNARCPAPIFSQDAQQTLQHLQRKGFNIVGYALEHSNVWTDNRRRTVDSKGLVRWIPSTSQEVAAERAARQAAQAEVVELKERIARAGVEHRRALHEALQQEREAFEKYMAGSNLRRTQFDDYENNYVHGKWEAWQARAALNAAPEDAITSARPPASV